MLGSDNSLGYLILVLLLILIYPFPPQVVISFQLNVRELLHDVDKLIKAPAAICRKVIEAKGSGNHQNEIWGDGHQTRSFMSIDDCTKGVEAISESEIHEPSNLGSSELVTIFSRPPFQVP
jgi:dTDP-D-glucose 4,6-dehydratase